MARAAKCPPSGVGRGMVAAKGAGKEGGAHAEQAEVAPVEEEAVPEEQEVEEEPAEEGPVGPAAKASGRTAPAEARGKTTEAVEVAQAFLVHFTCPS